MSHVAKSLPGSGSGSSDLAAGRRKLTPGGIWLSSKDSSWERTKSQFAAQIDSNRCAAGKLAVRRDNQFGDVMTDTEFSRDTPILILDDFVLARDCFAAMLSSHYSDVRCAWNLPTLFREHEDRIPKLILLNFGTRDSANLLQVCVDLQPEPKVIVYGLSEEWDVVSCAEAGASGLHLRSESLDQLLTLMNEVGSGRAHCSSDVSSILLGRVYKNVAGQFGVDPVTSSLTSREAEILRLIEEGLTNQQIATRLSVTVHTVKNHVHSLLAKLGVGSRAEASNVARAMRYAGSSGVRPNQMNVSR
jgi:DNA-binding NarL/FixJ family response regulator